VENTVRNCFSSFKHWLKEASRTGVFTPEIGTTAASEPGAMRSARFFFRVFNGMQKAGKILLTSFLVARLKKCLLALPAGEGSRRKMPPKKSNTLTEAELRLMKILWRRGESAVNDLVADLPEGKELAYNSVLTTIRILEQKGYVHHRQEGRAFVYRPVVAEQEASLSEVRRLMSRFFGGSREKLLLSLVGEGELTREELDRLKLAIAQAEPDATEAAQ
jgi:predicted transcriptional regulator